MHAGSRRLFGRLCFIAVSFTWNFFVNAAQLRFDGRVQDETVELSAGDFSAVVAEIDLPSAEGGFSPYSYELELTSPRGTTSSQSAMPGQNRITVNWEVGTYNCTWTATDDNGQTVTERFRIVVTQEENTLRWKDEKPADTTLTRPLRSGARHPYKLPEAEGGTGTISYVGTVRKPDGSSDQLPSNPGNTVFTYNTTTPIGRYEFTWTARDESTPTPQRITVSWVFTVEAADLELDPPNLEITPSSSYNRLTRVEIIEYTFVVPRVLGGEGEATWTSRLNDIQGAREGAAGLGLLNRNFIYYSPTNPKSGDRVTVVIGFAPFDPVERVSTRLILRATDKSSPPKSIGMSVRLDVLRTEARLTWVQSGPSNVEVDLGGGSQVSEQFHLNYAAGGKPISQQMPYRYTLSWTKSWGGAGTANDFTAGSTWTYEEDLPQAFGGGTVTFTMTATDADDNQIQRQWSLVIRDIVDPTIQGQKRCIYVDASGRTVSTSVPANQPCPLPPSPPRPEPEPE